MDERAGYREIEHMADWQIEAWAPDLAGLLAQCALGMQALSGVRLDTQAAATWTLLEISGMDEESLLVSFLSELLYISEQQGLGFEGFDLDLKGLNLRARLRARPLLALSKEIKAVTYHDLKITSGSGGVRTRVVFDV